MCDFLDYQYGDQDGTWFQDLDHNLEVVINIKGVVMVEVISYASLWT